MIIICYDGSEYAQAAADQAIRLLPKTPATVLTVFPPVATPVMPVGWNRPRAAIMAATDRVG